MSQAKRDNIFMRLITLLLWHVFLLMGLFPEFTFYWLREQGHVATQHALINNYHVITVALVLYMGLFVERRCISAGLPPWAAQAKGIQAGLVSMLAFLPVYMQDFFIYVVLLPSQYRVFLFGMIVIKCLAWLYLYQMILRYYLVSGLQVFLQMRLLFFFIPKGVISSKHTEYPGN